MKNIFFYLHVIITILVISIAFLPLKLVKQGLFLIPCLLTIIWLTYNKCPINQLHQNVETKKYHFFQECLIPYFPNITIKKCHQIATFLTSFIPTFIIIRLLLQN